MVCIDARRAFACDGEDRKFLYIKFHLPCSRPGWALQEILLQDVIVIISHNLPVNDTIISKEPKRGVDVILNVIYEDEEASRTNNGALGNSRWNVSPIEDWEPSTSTDCFLIERKAIIQSSVSPANAIVLELDAETLMRHSIKGLLEVQEDGGLLGCNSAGCKTSRGLLMIVVW